MADTDRLKRYRRASAPASDDSFKLYILKELDKLETTTSTMIDVLKLFEARLVAGGL
jgi:hypothetical protein